jgi:hypothetical protein
MRKINDSSKDPGFARERPVNLKKKLLFVFVRLKITRANICSVVERSLETVKMHNK